MLLLELRPEIPVSKKKVQIPKITRATHLGAGIQGFAAVLDNKPNTVVKIALTSKVDAYEQFIRLALAHQDNPFFPKIRAAKKYRIDTLTSEEHRELMADLGVYPPDMPSDYMLRSMNWIIIIAMEVLVPVKSSRVRPLMPQLFRDLYGDEVIQEIINDYGDDEYVSDIEFMLSGLGPWSSSIIKHTPNKHFKNALRLMAPLWNKWMKDTKASNMMIRPTPNGPQLVFLDPVWSNPSGQSGGGMSYVITYN